MHALIAIRERMLAQRVSRVNVETGKYEAVPKKGSSADALGGFAKQLSEERRMRLERQNATAPCARGSRRNSSSSKRR
jgi:hypothetical protein